jgi:hypothetical protein
VLRIINTAGEELGLWLTTGKCESRIEDISDPHLLRKLTTWRINVKKATIDVKVNPPVMPTVFACISPGGGRDTFVSLQRLPLAQSPRRDDNAGPPIVTGFILLTPEQLLNMSAICAVLATQLGVVNMKLVERSAPVGDGSPVQRVSLTFTADKSFLEYESMGFVRSIPMAPGRRA